MAENPNFEKLKQKLKKLEQNGSKEASYEQSLLQTLLYNIPDYVYFKDKNRRFVLASNFFCDLFKCSLEDIIGKKDEDLFPEEIAEETSRDDRHVIKTGIPLINKEEGGESIGEGGHWVLTTKLPWRDDKGNIIGLFGISRDITDRKQAEEALRKSGERYALATKAAKVGVWDWNIQTNEFYLDPNVKAILGYSDAEIPNDIEVWSNYVHPDDKQPVMEAFQDHIDGKIPEFAYEHRMLHKDGSIRWIMARGTAMRDDQGNPVRIVGTNTDITQRKQAEKALQASEEKFRALAESAPAAIIIVFGENFIYVNPAFEFLTGFTKEEALSMRFWELIHPDMQELIKERGLARQLGDTVPTRYQLKTLIKDGQERWFDVAASSIKYGGQTATLAMAYDITDSKRAEEGLREKDNKLEIQAKNLTEMNTALKVLLERREKEKKEIKESLLADIKKLVYPYVEKLENKGLNEDAQTFVKIIKSNINDVISPLASGLSSKYFALTPSEIQIADLIKHGKTSKEIASMLNVSPKAVSFHRGNLRKKMGLLNKKINLRTYLQNFPR